MHPEPCRRPHWASCRPRSDLFTFYWSSLNGKVPKREEITQSEFQSRPLPGPHGIKNPSIVGLRPLLKHRERKLPNSSELFGDRNMPTASPMVAFSALEAQSITQPSQDPAARGSACTCGRSHLRQLASLDPVVSRSICSIPLCKGFFGALHFSKDQVMNYD